MIWYIVATDEVSQETTTHSLGMANLAYAANVPEIEQLALAHQQAAEIQSLYRPRVKCTIWFAPEYRDTPRAWDSFYGTKKNPNRGYV